MADLMTGLKRTHYCGEVSAADAGHEVVVGGFTNKQRDKGELVFIDLRDRTGIVQLVFDDTTDRAVMAKAKEARSEFVLMAKGTVRMREAPNPELPTGDVEIYVTELRILARAQTPPFHITDETDTNEELRLRYRYLDLRRRSLQQNIIKRAKITSVAHEFFAKEGFIEIDTPMMIKSTPEGSRALINTFSLPAASVMRICVPTVSPNLPRSTWKCPLSIWRIFWHWANGLSIT